MKVAHNWGKTLCLHRRSSESCTLVAQQQQQYYSVCHSIDYMWVTSDLAAPKALYTTANTGCIKKKEERFQMQPWRCDWKALVCRRPTICALPHQHVAFLKEMCAATISNNKQARHWKKKLRKKTNKKTRYCMYCIPSPSEIIILNHCSLLCVCLSRPCRLLPLTLCAVRQVSLTISATQSSEVMKQWVLGMRQEIHICLFCFTVLQRRSCVCEFEGCEGSRRVRNICVSVLSKRTLMYWFSFYCAKKTTVKQHKAW